MLRIGLILVALATVLGLIGGYPIDSPRMASEPLVLISGFLFTAATVLILMTAGGFSSRADEPPGHIRP